MVYLSRTPTPGSLAVSEETVRYLLKCQQGTLKGSREVKETV